MKVCLEKKNLYAIYASINIHATCLFWFCFFASRKVVATAIRTHSYVYEEKSLKFRAMSSVNYFLSLEIRERHQYLIVLIQHFGSTIVLWKRENDHFWMHEDALVE